MDTKMMTTKERVLARIKSPQEWYSMDNVLDNGTMRMALLQVAFNEGWFLEKRIARERAQLKLALWREMND